MCIINDDYAVVKNGELVLWKVIKRNNDVGLWRETVPMFNELDLFCVGELIAHSYSHLKDGTLFMQGAFHCFLTRKVARKYLARRMDMGSLHKLKIIKVYANSKDVVSIGVEKYSGFSAVSVSKMTIKSLNHQR